MSYWVDLGKKICKIWERLENEELSSNEKWNAHLLRKGVVDLIQEKNLISILGNNLNQPDNIEMAKMLCFEAINKGAVSSKKYTCTKLFIQDNFELVVKVAAVYPQYFINKDVIETCFNSSDEKEQIYNEMKEYLNCHQDDSFCKEILGDLVVWYLKALLEPSGHSIVSFLSLVVICSVKAINQYNAWHFLKIYQDTPLPHINHDISQAFYGLGNMYYYCAGVEKDLEQAKILYMKAAVRREMLSQFRLGVMYEKGELVEINLEQAIIYYTLSATHGNGYAQKKLSDMYKEGKGVEIDMEKAKLFEQGSNRNIESGAVQEYRL